MAKNEHKNGSKHQQKDNPDPLAALFRRLRRSAVGRRQLMIGWDRCVGRFLIHLVFLHVRLSQRLRGSSTSGLDPRKDITADLVPGVAVTDDPASGRK